MKQPIKKILAVVCFLLAVFLVNASPAAAQTRVWSEVCVENYTNPNTNITYEIATIQGLQCLIANILSVAITIIGLAGFVMIIVGSFKYMLSGGNAKGTETARNTITFAIVGLVVALSAVIILNLIAAFTGVNIITNFVIPAST